MTSPSSSLLTRLDFLLGKQFVWITILLLSSSVRGDAASKANDYYSIGAHLAATSFSKSLQNEVKHSLGVQQIQHIINERPHWIEEVDSYNLLSDITQSIDQAAKFYVTALEKTYNKLTVSPVMNTFPHSDFRQLPSCSNVDHSIRTDGSSLPSCCIVPSGSKPYGYFSPKALTRAVSGALQVPGIYSSFLGVVDGSILNCPSTSLMPHRKRLWTPILTQLLGSSRRQVVIVIDVGGLSSEVQLIRAKSVARILLEATLPSDKYTVIATTDDGIVSSGCLSGSFRLREFVDQLRLTSPNATLPSHEQLLRQAFSTFVFKETETDFVIQYLSRGSVQELNEASSVLSTLGHLILEYSDAPKINAFALTDENGSSLPWATDFLRSVAAYNFSRYSNSLDSSLVERIAASGVVLDAGEVVLINGFEHRILTLPAIASTLRTSRHGDQSKRVSNSSAHAIWHFSEISKQMSVWWSKQSAIFSVVGVLVDPTIFADSILANQVLRMSQSDLDLQVYLVDSRGIVVAGWPAVPSGVYLTDWQKWKPGERWLINEMLSNDSLRGEFTQQTLTGETVTYEWSKLTEAPFTVVLGRREGSLPASFAFAKRESRQTADMRRIVFHDMNLNREDSSRFCSLWGSVSINDSAAVYLSPYVFDPSARFLTPEPQLTLNYWVYLSDRIGVIRSPAIREGIREEVGFLARVANAWMALPATAFVIRRYAATPRGVMVMFPASTVREEYDPTIHTWFTRAASSPGKIVFTGPNLHSELGDVVTISIALTIKVNGKGSLRNQLFVVLAMDVSSTYLHHLLEHSVASCREESDCALLSRTADLIHPGTSLSSMSMVEAVERYHVAHVNPVLATHMLSEPSVMTKTQCITVGGGSVVRRIYDMNLTFSRVLSIGCAGDARPTGLPPLHSQILLVPETDIFLVLLNASCLAKAQMTAFCPCSVSDRRCLFCARFDASECECPCTCSSSIYTDAAKKCAVPEPPVPICSPLISSSPFFTTSPKVHLPPCHNIRCSSISSPSQCRTTVGCEWCWRDSSLATLPAPFCAPLSQCYQGIRDRTTSRSVFDPVRASTSSIPVGLLAALFILIFLVLFVVVYICYRGKLSPLDPGQSTDSSFPFMLFSHFSPAGNRYFFDHHGLSSSDIVEKELVLASFERSAPASLRIGAPTVTDSDLGYSTMTERNTLVGGDDGSTYASSSKQPNRFPSPKMPMPMCEESCLISTAVDVHRPPTPPQLLST